jgi:hypothetical protein
MGGKEPRLPPPEETGKVHDWSAGCDSVVREWARDMRQLSLSESFPACLQSITSLDGLGLGFSGIEHLGKGASISQA